jgi:hypothetical protein
MTEQTLEQRFDTLESERLILLDRKRECAEYTFPIMLPPENWDEQDELDTPLNSAPAIGAAALAAKIANAVLPTNGSPIVSPNVMVPMGVPAAAYEQVQNTISMYDAEIMTRLQSSNFRPELHNVCLDLVIIGDTLLELLPNGNFRKHRLDNYVVIRKEDGSIYELVVRTWVDPETLPDRLKNRPGPSGSYKQGNRLLEPKYTRCVWNEGKKRYDVTDEFRGEPINSKTYYTVLPYFALKYGTSASNNYGLSIIESLLGDIRSLMAHSLALLQGSAANSEFRLCVNPAGVTDLGRMANSANGDWVSARREDVFVMQLGSPVQVQVTMAAVEKFEQTILKALLYNLAYTGQNRERVTATEINATIQSIEGGLSGILSAITQELHVPLVKRLSFNMANDENTDQNVRVLAQGVVNDVAPLKLRSGIEALHREIQSMRLMQGVQIIGSLPPTAVQDIKWRNVVFDLMAGLGFVGDRYLLTEEEKMQAQQQAMQMRVAEETATSAGVAAGEQMMQQPQMPPEGVA